MATNKRLFRELRDYALLILLGFVMTWLGLSCRGCHDNPEKFLIMASFTSLIWVFLWKGNEYLGEYISTKISWVAFPLKRFLVSSLVTVIYTFLSVYALTWTYDVIFDLNISAGVKFSVLISISISMFMHGKAFLENWRKAAIELERYQQQTIAARYESLKNQVNPHFLFNSLNALSNLVYEDEAKAALFIDELAEVYRYVLETQEKEVVPLEDELNFLDSYLYLQKIRFGSKLVFESTLHGVQAFVPPLSLQMLIENAIKHNIISEDDPLTIKIYHNEDHIIVENNIQIRATLPDESAGMGLENISKRYEMVAGKGIKITETSDHFMVKLPLLTKELTQL